MTENATIMLCAALALLASSACAAPCVSAGERSAHTVKLDPKAAMPTAYVSWSFAVDRVLSPRVVAIEAALGVTCVRGAFQANGVAYTLTGGNAETFPRRAVSDDGAAERPRLVLAPIRDMRAAADPRGETSDDQTPTFALLLIDPQHVTAVRVYKKVPTDEILLRDFAEVLTTGGQPFARMDRPDGKVAIVLSNPPKAVPAH